MAGRPYSPSERLAFGNALIGQAGDTMSTSMALTDPRVREGNVFYWNDEDIDAVLTGKLFMLGVGSILCS